MSHASDVRTYRYDIVDVFTETRFSGNQLAVVFDAEGIDDPTMQQIAREFNLSETVFCFQPEHDPSHAHAALPIVARLRIFTPECEMPFAGHPTIGSAFALTAYDRVPFGASEFVLHENVGHVKIRLERRDPFMAWFETPAMTVGAPVDRATIASALSIDAGDMLEAPPEIVGAGNDFTYVALRSPEAVDRVFIDASAFRSDRSLAAATGVFVFALSEGGVYARMLAPLAGVPEDPATGSATGPLALYLTRHGLIPLTDGYAFVNEQGVRMGRRSLLHAKLRVRDGTLVTVDIGGSAVPVMTGELRV